MRIKIDGALVREDIQCSIESKNETVDLGWSNAALYKATKLSNVIVTFHLTRDNVAYGSDNTINLVDILDFKDVPFHLERWQRAFCKVMNYTDVKTCYDPRLSTPNALFFKEGFEYKK